MSDPSSDFIMSIVTEARSYVLGGTLTADEAVKAVIGALALLIAHEPRPDERRTVVTALPSVIAEQVGFFANNPAFRAKADSRDPAIFSRSTQ